MKILICASSRDEIRKDYIELTKEVCEIISQKGYDLIFGAASTGMMGEEIKHFHNIDSYTVKKYVDDLKNIPSTNEYILDTTFDRTKEMYNNTDKIIVLPGGTGTLSELFSILEENRSISNPKELIIYNYKNYYDKVLEIIDDAVNNNFNSNDIKTYYKVIDNLDKLKEAL